jgi:hypothetical protein
LLADADADADADEQGAMDSTLLAVTQHLVMLRASQINGRGGDHLAALESLITPSTQPTG